MSCSPDVLKDYLFGELPRENRLEVEAHIAACAFCRDELAALRTTQNVLLSVRDEEPPRRIAFVSDKVFEQAWWRRLWNSGAKLGFASAVLVAGSIVAHGYLSRPVPVAAGPAVIDEAKLNAEVESRVRVAVEKAVAESERRQGEQILRMVNARQRESEQQIQDRLLNIREYLVRMNKRNAVFSRANYDQYGVSQ
jgi:anti-sigma factor RsiW